MLVLALPTSAIKDRLRANTVRKQKQPLYWEDRPGELLGWLTDTTDTPSLD